MVFDEEFSVEIIKYGIGLTTRAGKYHLLASLSKENRVKQLCLSQIKEIDPPALKKIKWFSDESSVIKALQENPRACNKCMRAIETITLGLSLSK
jgi:hypothetical protein